MGKQFRDRPNKNPGSSSAAGFSLLELLIVVALVGIVCAMALLGFQKSNRSFRLTGATRILSANLETARVDSVRRHGGASININSATSYTVNADFDGTGTSTARTINLPDGTTLSYSLPPANTSINPSATPLTIAYDWRGRSGTTALITVTDSTAGVGSSTVAVGQAGDVSTDTTVTGPVTTPTPQVAVSTTTAIKTMQ
jgi:prepilin-type N-terminal cleavage/methylation domain-containing protein